MAAWQVKDYSLTRLGLISKDNNLPTTTAGQDKSDEHRRPGVRERDGPLAERL